MKRFVIDVSNFEPDISYDEGLELCEQLELIEMLEHGNHDYGRVTQKGKNVLRTLLQMAVNASNPKNALKGS